MKSAVLMNASYSARSSSVSRPSFALGQKVNPRLHAWVNPKLGHTPGRLVVETSAQGVEKAVDRLCSVCWAHNRYHTKERPERATEASQTLGEKRRTGSRGRAWGRRRVLWPKRISPGNVEGSPGRRTSSRVRGKEQTLRLGDQCRRSSSGLEMTQMRPSIKAVPSAITRSGQVQPGLCACRSGSRPVPPSPKPCLCERADQCSRPASRSSLAIGITM